MQKDKLSINSTSLVGCREELDPAQQERVVSSTVEIAISTMGDSGNSHVIRLYLPSWFNGKIPGVGV